MFSVSAVVEAFVHMALERLRGGAQQLFPEYKPCMSDYSYQLLHYKTYVQNNWN